MLKSDEEEEEDEAEEEAEEEERLAAGDRADDEVGLGAGCDRLGKRGIGGFVGQILAAGEETEKGPALLGDVVADGAAEHRVTGLERVEDRALGNQLLNLELDFALDAGQRSKVERKF